MIYKGRPDFPYTHDLKVLLDMLEESGVVVPVAAARAPDLTRYVVSTRYPRLQRLGEDEFEQIITTARAVVEWVESQVPFERQLGGDDG